MQFEQFLVTELPGLGRCAAVLTGDRQLAHDVLTDALIVASARWPRIAGMDHPAAYVRRIVVTTFLSDRRRTARRRTEPTDDVAVLDLPHPDLADRVHDRDADTAPLVFPAAGDQLALTGGPDVAAQHCHSQVIAWPLASGGLVDERALRSAVNECAVGLGDRTAVATRYTVTRLDAVVAGTGLWTGTAWETALPAAADHPILVVRLEGSFPALAPDGAPPPTAVQIYVDAGSKYWAGMQFRTPVDPAGLGSVVTDLPG